jgi:hypothetical protein
VAHSVEEVNKNRMSATEGRTKKRVEEEGRIYPDLLQQALQAKRVTVRVGLFPDGL